MKNYNIERILEPAFKLFLMYNYESVSTAKLEEATGLTRGAIFYKYKTKESIFKAVIDRYVLDFHSKPINTNVGNCTISLICIWRKLMQECLKCILWEF